MPLVTRKPAPGSGLKHATPRVCLIPVSAVLAVSGYLGGKLTYRYGVRVTEETTQAEGYDEPEAPARHYPAA
jgi:hypothetical protein